MASLAVTASAVVAASWVAISPLGPVLRDTAERNFLRAIVGNITDEPVKNKIRIFVWDELWRVRAGRLLPAAEDWGEIFEALHIRGAKIILIPDEEVFSRVNASAVGYIQAFRDAASKGLQIYAPLRFVDPHPGNTPADPILFGAPVETYIRDASQPNDPIDKPPAVTSLLDLKKIPDISSKVLSGPAPEFADVVAGAGLIGIEPDAFMPLARWREDRFIADLALAPRESSWGVTISGGKTMVANKIVAPRDGFIPMPSNQFSRDQQFFIMPEESIEILLRSNVSDALPELVIMGAANSASIARITAIANAAMSGALPAPLSIWSVAGLAVVALIAYLIVIPTQLASAILLGIIWVVASVFVSLIYQKNIGLPATAVFISAVIPSLFEVMRRSAKRDVRIRKIASDLSGMQLAKSAMAQQARMVVHDLRRALKGHDPANIAYLDGFLVELMALEQPVSGWQKSIAKSFSIVDLTEASLSQLMPGFNGRELDFEISWQHHSRLFGDAAAMRRIIDNLIDNAATSAPRGSRINIHTREIGMQTAEGSVTACMMTIGNVVSNFSTNDFAVLGDGRVRNRQDGRGLGLLIVRRLAESMGGLVQYHYESSSCVVEIQVAIPVDLGLPDLDVVMRRSNHSGLRDEQKKRRLIIVVDDSPFVRDMWERQSTEADVIVFRSPSEFLAQIAADVALLSRAPIMVIDYMFDRESMDGITLAGKAREAGVKDIVICSDWDLGHLKNNDSGFPIIRKGLASVEQVMSAIQKPSA